MAIKAVATTDYAELTSGFPNTTGPLTVMHWFKHPSLSSGGFKSLVVLGTNIDDCWLVAIADGTFAIVTSGGGAVNSLVNVCNDAWHSVALTIQTASPFTGRVYTDGVERNSGATSTAITPTALRLGTDQAGTLIAVDTVLYGLKIWNAELTPAEILIEHGSYSPVRTANLYGSWLLPNVSTFTDDSGNGHHFTRNGSSFTNDTDPPPFTMPGVVGAFGTEQSAYDRYLLEDGSGVYLLEQQFDLNDTTIPSLGPILAQ